MCARALACAALVLGPTPMLAQDVEQTGTFHVLWGDPRDASSRPVVAHTLSGDDGRTYVLRIDDARLARFGGAAALHGRRVTVRAEAQPQLAPGPIGGASELVVADLRLASALPLPAGPSLARARVAGAPALEGSLPYVTLLCRFPDFDLGLEPPSYWEERSGASGPYGAGTYWAETSDGRVDMSGSVVSGWHVLPQPSTYYMPTPDMASLDLLARDCAAAADSAVFFPDYAGVNFQFNASIGCCAWGSGGFLELDGVPKAYGFTWFGGDWGAGVVAHEIGHTFGLPHSSGDYGLTYDSKWDVMSIAGHYNPPGTSHQVGTATLAEYKDRLGWIPSSRRFVAPPGRSEITLERSALPGSDGDYLIAVIPIRGSATAFYTLEARRRAGFDVAVPWEGVLINRNPGTGPRIVDVDMNVDPNDAGAIWVPGESWYDRANDIRVTVEERIGEAYRVTIDVGEWTEIAVDRPTFRHDAVAGVDTLIVDSVIVDVTGPDAANATWTATTFNAHIVVHTPGGTGPGVVRWSMRTGTMPAGRYIGSLLIRSDSPQTYLAVTDTLVIAVPPTLIAGFTRPARPDTLVAGRTRQRFSQLGLSGPGADSAAWTLSSSSSRLVLDQAAGVGSAYVSYTRDARGVAPGLYVDSLRLAFAAGGGAVFVDSVQVIAQPAVTITRAPGAPHITQEGAATVDSVWIAIGGELSATAPYFAYGIGSAPYFQPVSYTNAGSGWLRFTRRAGTLAPGTHVGAIGIVLAVDDSARAEVADTFVVDAAPPAVHAYPTSRRDSVGIGTSSIDSVWVVPEGAGAATNRWAMQARPDRLMPINRNGTWGAGIGPGWLVWGRVMSDRAPGVYVDTIRIGFENGTGTAAIVIDTLVLTGSVPLDPIVIESNALRRAGVVGVAYADTLRATGGEGALRWSIATGSLPAGLALDSITGIIAGMPVAAGSFAFGGVVRDSAGQTATREFGIEVTEPPVDPLVIVSDSMRPQATMGAPYADALAATGGAGEVRWTLASGALPPGVALDSMAGALAGVPEQAGTFTFVLTARATGGAPNGTVTRGFAIAVVEPTLAEANVIGQLMDGTGLTADQRRYLDLLGNRNGRVDVGDVSAWLERQ